MSGTLPRHLWRSGWCGTGWHPRCTGTYAGVTCTCDCHTPPARPARPVQPGLFDTPAETRGSTPMSWHHDDELPENSTRP